jgi:hypothetical protein
MKRGKPFVSEDLLIATIAGLLAWIITLALRAAKYGVPRARNADATEG